MSTLVAQTISNGTVSTSTANVINGAKAWVNFDGTGTVAIRASYNVSSVTDSGLGLYTVNFTNALVDGNYAVAISTNSGQISGNQVIGAIYSAGGIAGAATLKTTTQLRVSAQTTSPTFAAIDVTDFNVSIFR